MSYFVYKAPSRVQYGLHQGLRNKESACNAEVTRDMVQSLYREDPLEKGLARHFSILAWRLPWTEEPGRLQSMGYKESDMIEVI